MSGSLPFIKLQRPPIFVRKNQNHQHSSSFKIHFHQKTEYEDSKQSIKKTPEYFQSLKNQLFEDREKKIFKLDPELSILRSRSSQKQPQLKKKKYKLRQQRSISCPNLTKPKFIVFASITTQVSGIKVLQRSSSCICSECAQNNSKYKFTLCFPRKYFCAQHQKVIVKKRFRKLVICVEILLFYKKNISKMRSRRFKRLSLKQQAILLIQRPNVQEKIQQEKILKIKTLCKQTSQSGSDSDSDSSKIKRMNLNKLKNPQLYFKNNHSNNKTLNLFIINKEKKLADDIKLNSLISINLNSLEDSNIGESQTKGSFMPLQQFQKNLVLQNKSKSIQKLPLSSIRDEQIPPLQHTISSSRQRSGYLKSGYQSGIQQEGEKFQFNSPYNNPPPKIPLSHRNNEYQSFTESRRCIKTQNKSREKSRNKSNEKITSKNFVLQGLVIPQIKQQLQK